MTDEKELILELDKFVKKGILKKVLDDGEWKYVKCIESKTKEVKKN